jgi:hypothetical protein
MQIGKFFEPFLDLENFSNFLFIFSTALIVIIGIIAFLESLIVGLKDDINPNVAKKAVSVFFYSLILVAAGVFWLNFFWQNTTGSVLMFNASFPEAVCTLFVCG